MEFELIFRGCILLIFFILAEIRILRFLVFRWSFLVFLSLVTFHILKEKILVLREQKLMEDYFEEFF